MKLSPTDLRRIVNEEIVEFFGRKKRGELYQDPEVGLYKVDDRGTETLTGHVADSLDDLKKKVDRKMRDLKWVEDDSFFGGHYEGSDGTVYKVFRTRAPKYRK